MARVLVVDDEIPFAEMLARAIVDEGHACDVAHDGREGLETMRRSPPRLVVLDLMMPKLDGARLLTEMRRDAALRDIRVLVTSVSNPPSSLEKVDASLRKPFEMDVFLTMVRRLLV